MCILMVGEYLLFLLTLPPFCMFCMHLCTTNKQKNKNLIVNTHSSNLADGDYNSYGQDV